MSELATASPITRVPEGELPKFKRPLDTDGIARVLMHTLDRHMHLELSVEELVEMLPPPDEGGRRGGGRKRSTKFDQCCAFELRYCKSLSWSQGGVVGKLEEGLFRYTVEDMFLRELNAVQQAQPNGNWKLVGGWIYQLNLARTVPVGAHGEIAPRVEKPYGDDYYTGDNAAAVLAQPTVRHVPTPDIRWWMPVVFADVARGELVDPSQVEPNAKPTTENVYKYMETRQLRWLSDGQRQNREKAVELLLKWGEFRAKLAEEAVPRVATLAALSDGQLAEARKMRDEGFPLGRVASLLGVDAAALIEALDR